MTLWIHVGQAMERRALGQSRCRGCGGRLNRAQHKGLGREGARGFEDSSAPAELSPASVRLFGLRFSDNHAEVGGRDYGHVRASFDLMQHPGESRASDGAAMPMGATGLESPIDRSFSTIFPFFNQRLRELTPPFTPPCSSDSVGRDAGAESTQNRVLGGHRDGD
jgi:hypothetical protein